MKDMKALAITHKGLEAVSAREIEELIGVKAKTEDSVVLFEAKQMTDLCLLCYKAQSVIKILYLLKQVEFSKPKEIFDSVKGIDFSGFIGKETKFAVRCLHIGEHDFSSNEIETGVGSKIEGSVNLEDPDVTIFVYIYGNLCYIGIDFAGFDLSKRHYRIFANTESLRATVAYSLLRISEYKPTDVLVDPFCTAGTILIEAALYATSMPVNFFNKDKFAFLRFKSLEKIDFDKFLEDIDKSIDKEKKLELNGFDSILNRIVSARKNAKIAGIDKKINLSKVDVEWLDTKLDEGSVNKVVSMVPFSRIDEKKMEKLYKEFFYQLKYVLAKKGKAVLITRQKDLISNIAVENGFKISENMEIEQGKQPLSIIVIVK